MIGVDSDEDSDSFNNSPVRQEAKEASPEPMLQERLVIPRTCKRQTFTFPCRPFGINWKLENGELVVLSTSETKDAAQQQLPNGSVLIAINNEALNFNNLETQLKTCSMPAKLTFKIFGRRSLNYHESTPKLSHPWKTPPRITNVVAVCKTGVKKVNLRSVATQTYNVEFNPKGKTVAVFMKMRNPPCSATIFSTGTVNIQGCRSEASALIACRKVARRLQKVGVPITSLTSFQIKSVSGVADMHSKVRLQDLHDSNMEQTSFDRCLRPGCVFNFPNGTCEVSSGGSLNFMGIASVQTFWDKTEELYSKILPHCTSVLNREVQNFLPDI